MKEIVYLSRVSPRIAYLLQKIAYSLLVNLVSKDFPKAWKVYQSYQQGIAAFFGL